MTDNLERRVCKALEAEVDAILQGPVTGQIDPVRLAKLHRSVLTPGPTIVRAPALPDLDAEYRGMAAREGDEKGLSDSLEKKIRRVEEGDDA